MDGGRLEIRGPGRCSARNDDRALEHGERAGERAVGVRQLDLERLRRKVHAQLEAFTVGAEPLAEQLATARADDEVRRTRGTRRCGATDNGDQSRTRSMPFGAAIPGFIDASDTTDAGDDCTAATILRGTVMMGIRAPVTPGSRR